MTARDQAFTCFLQAKLLSQGKQAFVLMLKFILSKQTNKITLQGFNLLRDCLGGVIAAIKSSTKSKGQSFLVVLQVRDPALSLQQLGWLLRRVQSLAWELPHVPGTSTCPGNCHRSINQSINQTHGGHPQKTWPLATALALQASVRTLRGPSLSLTSESKSIQGTGGCTWPCGYKRLQKGRVP